MEDAIISKADKLTSIKNVFSNKKILLLLLVVVLAALAWYFTTSRSGKAADSYLTDTVRRGDISVTISATGTIEPTSRVSLAFKNAEIIKDIYVKVGDSVTPGQLLAEQNTSNLEASVVQSTANLRVNEARLELLRKGATQEDRDKANIDVSTAKASFETARIKLENYQLLYQEGAISKTEYDSAELEYITAEGRLKQAEYSLSSLEAGNRAEDIEAAAAQVESSNAQLKLAENDLTGAKLYSPIDGIVSAVNGAVGQRATANNNNVSGGGFIDIISESLQVKAQVNEADIGKAAVGQTVEFSVNSFPNRNFSGTLESIAPEAYNQSNIQIYDIVIQMDQRYPELKAGMPCDVTIIAAKADNALIVPKSAVVFAANYLRQHGAQTQENQGAAGNEPNQGQERFPQRAGGADSAANPDKSGGTDRAGRQEAAGAPDSPAQLEGAGQQEGAGRTETAPQPEAAPQPDGAGPQERALQPEGTGGPDGTEHPRRADNAGNEPNAGTPSENAVPRFVNREGNQVNITGAQEIQPAVIIVMDQDGKLSPRRVTLGLSNLSNYEVLDGLQEGELVVTGSSGSGAGGSGNQSGGQGGNQTFIPNASGGGRIMMAPGIGGGR